MQIPVSILRQQKSLYMNYLDSKSLMLFGQRSVKFVHQILLNLEVQYNWLWLMLGSHLLKQPFRQFKILNKLKQAGNPARDFLMVTKRLFTQDQWILLKCLKQIIQLIPIFLHLITHQQ